MAKEFIFNQFNHWCEDLCTFKNDGTMIGSDSCKECRYNQHIGNSHQVVTCPKIIRRSAITGKVIMRKPK